MSDDHALNGVWVGAYEKTVAQSYLSICQISSHQTSVLVDIGLSTLKKYLCWTVLSFLTLDKCCKLRFDEKFNCGMFIAATASDALHIFVCGNWPKTKELLKFLFLMLLLFTFGSIPLVNRLKQILVSLGFEPTTSR